MLDLQLKKLRKLAGYKKQSDLADALGVPHRRYESWEREEAMMSLEQAYNVTEVLGCTLDELCGRKVIRTFPDPSQAAINASYENMNDEGRKALLKVARGMEKDTDNRIFKDSPEYTDGSAAMGA